MTSIYGFEESAWKAALEEGKDCLVSCAKRKQTIPYSKFILHIHSIQFEGPHDPRLPHLLGEISSIEFRAGRGMLSALVVHKHGDSKPGAGFFELARELGNDTSDDLEIWSDEVNKIFDTWKE